MNQKAFSPLHPSQNMDTSLSKDYTAIASLHIQYLAEPNRYCARRLSEF